MRKLYVGIDLGCKTCAGAVRDSKGKLLETCGFPTSAELDFTLRRVGATGWAYNNRLLALLRRIKVPIPGYYSWEIVGVRSLS